MSRGFVCRVSFFLVEVIGRFMDRNRGVVVFFL